MLLLQQLAKDDRLPAQDIKREVVLNEDMPFLERVKNPQAALHSKAFIDAFIAICPDEETLSQMLCPRRYGSPLPDSRDRRPILFTDPETTKNILDNERVSDEIKKDLATTYFADNDAPYWLEKDNMLFDWVSPSYMASRLNLNTEMEYNAYAPLMELKHPERYRNICQRLGITPPDREAIKIRLIKAGDYLIGSSEQVQYVIGGLQDQPEIILEIMAGYNEERLGKWTEDMSANSKGINSLIGTLKQINDEALIKQRDEILNKILKGIKLSDLRKYNLSNITVVDIIRARAQGRKTVDFINELLSEKEYLFTGRTNRYDTIKEFYNEFSILRQLIARADEPLEYLRTIMEELEKYPKAKFELLNAQYKSQGYYKKYSCYYIDDYRGKFWQDPKTIIRNFSNDVFRAFDNEDSPETENKKKQALMKIVLDACKDKDVSGPEAAGLIRKYMKYFPEECQEQTTIMCQKLESE